MLLVDVINEQAITCGANVGVEHSQSIVLAKQKRPDNVMPVRDYLSYLSYCVHSHVERGLIWTPVLDAVVHHQTLGVGRRSSCGNQYIEE